MRCTYTHMDNFLRHINKGGKNQGSETYIWEDVYSKHTSIHIRT